MHGELALWKEVPQDLAAHVGTTHRAVLGTCTHKLYGVVPFYLVAGHAQLQQHPLHVWVLREAQHVLTIATSARHVRRVIVFPETETVCDPHHIDMGFISEGILLLAAQVDVHVEHIWEEALEFFDTYTCLSTTTLFCPTTLCLSCRRRKAPPISSLFCVPRTNVPA